MSKERTSRAGVRQRHQGGASRPTFGVVLPAEEHLVAAMLEPPDSSTPTRPAAGAVRDGPESVRVPWGAVVVYLAIAFAVSWGLESLVLTGVVSPFLAGPVVALGMLGPLLGSLAASRVAGMPWLSSVGLGRVTLRRVLKLGLLGVGFAAFVTAATISLSVALGVERFDLAAFLNAEALGNQPLPMAGWQLVALQFLGALIAPFTVNGAFALGEEVGWRGWLLEALRPLGRLSALALIGACWGLWHTPLIVAGLTYGTGLNPVLAVALFCLGATLLGTVLTWLRIRGGSVLPAAITHGAMNIWGGFTAFAYADDGADRLWLTAVPGAVGMLVVGVIAVALLVRGDWRPPDGVPYFPR